MALTIVTAPSIEPVTLAKIKTALRIDNTSVEDDMLEDLITAAREYCEGFQNRAYITQVWELWLDAFPGGDFIPIQLPPLQSVGYIKYYDTSDVEYTLAATEYFVDTKSEPGKVALKYSKTWPSTTLRPNNGVVVRFTCGYGAAATAVPERVKQAMILHIKLDYDDYYPDVRKAMERSRDALLWQERIVPT